MALAPVTLLQHKPAGLREQEARALLVPAQRAANDGTGPRTIKKHFTGQGALLALPDPASGLAVYSQDPRIVRKLTEDARVIEQEVIADVTGQIRPGGLERLCHGLSFNGHPLPPIKVSWQNEQRLRFALKGIAPGQVPSMCEQVGLQLQALRRIRIGRVPMGQLPPGQWHYLQAGERF
jgi:23S rRNA pseudouridine2604 synthase